MSTLIRGALVVAGVLAAGAAAAQPITVDRERSLGLFGSVRPVNVDVRPVSAGPGIVFTQPVRHQGARSIRVRFTLVEGADTPFWSVAVVGTGGRRWEHRPEPEETEFWSDEFPGDHVTVELRTSQKDVKVSLVLDRTAGTSQPTVPRSITEPDDRQRWNRVAEPYLTLGRSVVRLRFVDDARKKIFVCTGWLVFSSRHVLTNDHCINSPSEVRSALADLDYTAVGVPARSVRLRRLLMSDARLDFSLIELAEALDRPPLPVSRAGSIGPNQQLAIIQHPAGEPKQLSERGCLVGLATVPGVTPDPTDFEHACDTLGGSSGSPVLDGTTLTVVGLHHLGFLEGDKPVNRAVKMEEVLGVIARKFPDLVKQP